MRPYERETGWALPDSLDGVIAPDHPVRFVAGYIDGLSETEWETMGIALEGKTHGAPRYHPRLLLGVWLWGFMTGVRSSRRLESACREQVSYWWLTGSQMPDHNTLWRFYEAHRAGMRYLLTDTVQTAVRLGLVDLAIGAVDGTKVAGNAARDRNYDQARLDRLLERCEQAIAELEAQNATDETPPVPRLPPALSSATALRERIREARARMGERTRVNLTDPDARIMPSRKGWMVGYNAQAMVSPLVETVAGSGGMLMTAAEVITEPDDYGQLVPMIIAAAEATGTPATTTVADSGYRTLATLQTCAELGLDVVLPPPRLTNPAPGPYHREHFPYDATTDTYRCPEGQTLTFRRITHRAARQPHRVYGAGAAICRACPAFGHCTTDGNKGRVLEVAEPDSLLAQFHAQMTTEAAKATYARRKALIEPVFGVLKEQRGLRRFLLRGTEQVQAEWSLLATTFNLRVLARIWQMRPALFAW